MIPFYAKEKHRVDIINSTLGKALGGAAGGYTTSSKQVVDLLRQRSRPYLFSNSIPPAVAAGASKVYGNGMRAAGSKCAFYSDNQSLNPS